MAFTFRPQRRQRRSFSASSTSLILIGIYYCCLVVGCCVAAAAAAASGHVWRQRHRQLTPWTTTTTRAQLPVNIRGSALVPIYAKTPPADNYPGVSSSSSILGTSSSSSSTAQQQSSSSARGGSMPPPIIQQQQQQRQEDDEEEEEGSADRATETSSPSTASPDAATAGGAGVGNSSLLSRQQQQHHPHHPAYHHTASKKEMKKVAKNYKKYAKKLKNRNARNLRRKVMHCSFGLFFASLNHFIPKRMFVTGMVILSSGTLVMELLRYQPGFAWMNDILHIVLGQSLRKHEMEGKFTGSFYFFTGVTVTAALFDRNAATMGIAQLALADPSASYFGRATRHVYWSRIENGLYGFGRNKGVLGFLGGALFCFPFNYRVLCLANGGELAKLAVARASLALGLAGALADLAVPTPAVTLPTPFRDLPPLHIDDNFVVPIASAWACEKVFTGLGWKDIKLAKFLLWNTKKTMNKQHDHDFGSTLNSNEPLTSSSSLLPPP